MAVELRYMLGGECFWKSLSFCRVVFLPKARVGPWTITFEQVFTVFATRFVFYMKIHLMVVRFAESILFLVFFVSELEEKK